MEHPDLGVQHLAFEGKQHRPSPLQDGGRNTALVSHTAAAIVKQREQEVVPDLDTLRLALLTYFLQPVSIM